MCVLGLEDVTLLKISKVGDSEGKYVSLSIFWTTVDTTVSLLTAASDGGGAENSSVDDDGTH